MPKNFYVVDGSSLLHREYHSSLPTEVKMLKTEEEKQEEYWRLPNMNGHYVNGIDGFIASIIALKYYQKADYIAICFDSGRDDTFRREIFPDYKAQRAPSPLPLKDQFEYVVEVCEKLGLPVFVSPRYEADDYAGTIAKKFASEDVKVSLFTTDRDYFQLVDENISCCWMCSSRDKFEKLEAEYGKKGAPLGSIRFDKFTVKNEIGIWPDQITDWKGISGDSSDNIPGIKGVSDKTVIPLLNRYNTVEGIYNAMESKSEAEIKEEWKALGIKRIPYDAMLSGKESALFCKELATIKTDLDVPESLDDYRYVFDIDKFLDVSDELGLIKPMELFNRLQTEDLGEEMENVSVVEHREEPSVENELTEETPKEAEPTDEYEDDFYAFG